MCQNYLLNREHFFLLTTVCRCFLRLCWLFYTPWYLWTGNQCTKSLLSSWREIFPYDYNKKWKVKSTNQLEIIVSWDKMKMSVPQNFLITPFVFLCAVIPFWNLELKRGNRILLLLYQTKICTVRHPAGSSAFWNIRKF